MAARRPKYQEIKDDLRLLILQGAYTPGESFVTQQQVCERYDVSMLTAARALNELEAEGLVDLAELLSLLRLRASRKEPAPGR